MIVVKRIATIVLSLFVSFVFIQSLFYKFSGSGETTHIFNTLNEWALSLGLPGVFAEGAIFSGVSIGIAELIASSLLLIGLIPGRMFQKIGLLGSLMAIAVMSGAIFFHLFTPLGIDVLDDGGLLFTMACLVWVSGWILSFIRWQDLKQA